MRSLFHVAVLLSPVLWTGAALAEDEHRQLGPHQHGHGSLQIAVEGHRVSMELEAPGADIAGFEHEPSTPEQNATLAKAKATLADPLALFKLPASAGCKVTEAKVEIERGHHHHDEAKEPDKPAAAAEPAEAEHSGFDVDYILECASPQALTGIEFDYFKAFPNARELSVVLTTAKGQTKLDVSREKPVIDLGGLI
jgi:hypothetical protein